MVPKILKKCHNEISLSKLTFFITTRPCVLQPDSVLILTPPGVLFWLICPCFSPRPLVCFRVFIGERKNVPTCACVRTVLFLFSTSSTQYTNRVKWPLPAIFTKRAPMGLSTKINSINWSGRKCSDFIEDLASCFIEAWAL